jgi:hypothetical protein
MPVIILTLRTAEGSRNGTPAMPSDLSGVSRAVMRIGERASLQDEGLFRTVYVSVLASHELRCGGFQYHRRTSFDPPRRRMVREQACLLG